MATSTAPPIVMTVEELDRLEATACKAYDHARLCSPSETLALIAAARRLLELENVIAETRYCLLAWEELTRLHNNPGIRWQLPYPGEDFTWWTQTLASGKRDVSARLGVGSGDSPTAAVVALAAKLNLIPNKHLGGDHAY